MWEMWMLTSKREKIMRRMKKIQMLKGKRVNKEFCKDYFGGLSFRLKQNDFVIM